MTEKEFLLELLVELKERLGLSGDDDNDFTLFEFLREALEIVKKDYPNISIFEMRETILDIAHTRSKAYEDFLYELLEKAKLILKLDYPSNEIMTNYIKEAMEEAKNFTHRKDVFELGSAILRMALYKNETATAMSLSGESYGNASFNYLGDYPEYIMRELRSRRKAMLV